MSNRILKFRARATTLDKRWVYGSYIKKGEKHFIYEWEDQWQVPVDPETVGQLIGFLEKDDKEVWECDIVRWNVGTARNPIPTWSLVEWSENNQGFTPYINNTSEVIGNRFDNPDMLS